MEPETGQKFLEEVDEVIKLLESEHQIKKGRLTERVAMIKERLPRGSRVHALERIAAIRARDVRIWYPRRRAGQQPTLGTKPASATANGSAVGPGSGAQAGRISRTDVIKREVTEQSNERFAADFMSMSEEELATGFARLILRRRNGATREDSLASLRRITSLMEAKVLMGAPRPNGIGVS